LYAAALKPTFEQNNVTATKTEIKKLCKDKWDALDVNEKRMYEKQAAIVAVEHAKKVCLLLCN
jgi:chromosome condensin MukBEF ATPase and DNA-binding subunit MukB